MRRKSDCGEIAHKHKFRKIGSTMRRLLRSNAAAFARKERRSQGAVRNPSIIQSISSRSRSRTPISVRASRLPRRLSPTMFRITLGDCVHDLLDAGRLGGAKIEPHIRPTRLAHPTNSLVTNVNETSIEQ